jgi:hypothetical protein
MNNWKFGVVTGLVVVAMLVGARFLPSSNTRDNSAVKGETVNEESIDSAALAKHLTQVGAKVYGAAGCGACEYQKGLFGDNWQYITYVECGTEDGGQAEVCIAAEIEGYPTWEFSDGTKQIGVMSLSELAEKSAFTQ